MAWTLYISNQASSDIDDIWAYGFEHFGRQVADDYDVLIQQALADLMEDPRRAGTAPMQGSEDGMHAYPLRHSKQRARGKIRTPRHSVIYFILDADVVAVASISRDIRERHLSSLSREAIEDELDLP